MSDDTARFTFTLPTELLEFYRVAAKKQKVSMASLMREAIDEFLARVESESAERTRTASAESIQAR